MYASRHIALLILCATGAGAQALVSTRSGLIHVTDGEVYLGKDRIRATPETFFELRNGDELRTGDGRAEILLGPSVFLRLDTQSILRMVDDRLEEAQVELEKGTALVEVVDRVRSGRVEIAQGGTRTDLKSWGLYRFGAEPAELQVLGGEALVASGERTMAVGRGRAVQLNGTLSALKFSPLKADGLQEWAARRSFDLFVSSPEARAQRTDWEFTATGWLWNRNFQKRFFSSIGAAEYRRRFGMSDRQSFVRAQ